MQDKNTATLTIDGQTYELPIVRGTEGEVAVDVSCLRSLSGVITLDQGYANTGSCYSAITFVDGEKGILRYRGYPIEQLATQSSAGVLPSLRSAARCVVIARARVFPSRLSTKRGLTVSTLRGRSPMSPLSPSPSFSTISASPPG